MTLTESLISFSFAAGVLTLTPGLDTALILRTAATENSRKALQAAMGINAGCLVWGALVALGMGALLAASEIAFTTLKWIGAGYLCWLGLNMILRPRTAMAPETPTANARGSNWFVKGLFGNLLNPKMGVFYVSFLPQFVPSGYPMAVSVFSLAVIHVLIGTLWSCTLIAATRPLARWLRRTAVVKTLDRLTGCVFLAFAARLATTRR
ncbi:lysine transporter LysE [Chimaeribacter californicus]|uniref:Lysine transporter LysE n=1 Tax=Chimaeribacter californicus TaxID=2060067 RepID=A0A2N5E8F5_9GAMM|nr:LysE family translocator [Chimaeribacter californicus]PLR37953.1 lysine transporter LysE [Chimaeribacter californicus]